MANAATRLYHQESNPFNDALFDLFWPNGNAVITSPTTINYVATQTAHISMFRADGRHALLEVDPGTLGLSLANTGAAGLNEAVGAERAYGGRIIARNDGVANLFGVRMGTSISAALPTGYEWYSRTLFPIWTTQASELVTWLYISQGLFVINPPGDVLVNGVKSGGADVIPLETLSGGEEFALSAIRQILFRFVAVNAQATNRTVTVTETDPVAGAKTIWAQKLGQTAPATDELEIEKWVNTCGFPDTCLSYEWSGAPTTGLSLIPRMVQL